MQRIQRTRKKGTKLPIGTLCVSHPGLFGNPFKIDNAVDRFRQWIYAPQQDELRQKFITYCKDWDIKFLACWCPHTIECHGDVWLEIWNDYYERKSK